MNKLNIFIGEKFAPELDYIIAKCGFDDVLVQSYPCMCEYKGNKKETKRLLEECRDQGEDGVILCGKFCDIIKLVPEDASFKLVTLNHCFNHLTNNYMIEYILEKGGYIIGSGWLKNWREHIKTMGFDQKTAQGFYQESYKELVFFDSGIDCDAETNLAELAQFLELPYVTIPLELDSLELLVNSIVAEWILHQSNQKNAEALSEAQSQCAEYAAILDILGKIASCNNKRDVIEKIKGIFLSIMGAGEFKFYSADSLEIKVPENVKNLLAKSDTKYQLLEKENRFYVVIDQKDKVHGMLEAAGFMFPQYINKYLNFAVAISQICALLLTNIERFEELARYKDDLEYRSYHDSLTGLYNRAYFNEIMSNRKVDQKVGIFSIDIDGLKYVNDNFGHLEGDKLIVATANLLRKSYRETDIIARIGGDEFIAIVPDCDESKARMLKQRIDNTIFEYNKSIEEKHLKLSISVGYEIEGQGNNDLEELMRKADFKMYQNKAAKKREFDK